MIVTTYVWLQYPTSSSLELSITSPFRAGGKLCRRWSYIIPIILSIPITFSVISIVVILVLPTRNAARKLCRPSSVVFTVMLYRVRVRHERISICDVHAAGAGRSHEYRMSRTDTAWAGALVFVLEMIRGDKNRISVS